MKTLLIALFASLLLIGCGSDDTTKTDKTLQPQVENAAIRPPAPPAL